MRKQLSMDDWAGLVAVHRHARRLAALWGMALVIFGGGLVALGVGLGEVPGLTLVIVGAMALALSAIFALLWLEHGERASGIRALAEEWAELRRRDPQAAAGLVGLARRVAGLPVREGERT